jgi:hypothetical protein
MRSHLFYTFVALSCNGMKDKPDTSKLRPALFWDTDISKIEWNRQKRAVIERVFERGNKTEQEEIIRFYGSKEISRYLSHSFN